MQSNAFKFPMSKQHGSRKDKKDEKFPKIDESLFNEKISNVIALRTGSFVQQYMLFKFKKKIKIEGHGTYEVEITNLVNPQTQKTKSILPSTLDVNNQNAFKAANYKSRLEKKMGVSPTPRK